MYVCLMLASRISSQFCERGIYSVVVAVVSSICLVDSPVILQGRSFGGLASMTEQSNRLA